MDFARGNCAVVQGRLAQTVLLGESTPQAVLDVVKGIEEMDWPTERQAGTKLDLPAFNVSTQQQDRFIDGFIIYREEFENIYNVVAAELGQEDKDAFHNNMPVYLHGPKGECTACPSEGYACSGSDTSQTFQTMVYRNRQVTRASLRGSTPVVSASVPGWKFPGLVHRTVARHAI